MVVPSYEEHVANSLFTMKRRQRRPVLDINGEQSDSPRRRWQNKYQQIAVDHPEQNGSSNNPLASLLRQYNSDSETEESKQDSNKLDDQVNDFLKEIQLIAPEQPKPNATEKCDLTTFVTQQNLPHANQHSSLWQECFDESTGYPYYWHTETNEVTWEMPAEIRLYQESASQDSITHASHAVQWANFSSNTYPEPQTNIPEGMIPKEVVARNRNKQVSVQRDEQQKLQIEPSTPKKAGVKEDDSDDGKIEMITSFGNDESESDASDNESFVQKESKEVPVIKSRLKPQTASTMNPNTNKKLDDVSKNIKIGPSLPPDITPMIYGPANSNIQIKISNNSGHGSKINDDKNTSEMPCALSVSCYEDPSSLKIPLKPDDVNEEDILKRLKNQAKLLQSLGGEIPESVETLIKEDSIDISQAGKEVVLDHKQCVEVLENISACVMKQKDGMDVLRNSEQKKLVTPEKEIKISLVAGYSDDSDAEEETSPKKEPIRPLFPISDYHEAKSSISSSLSVPKVSKSVSDEISMVSTDGIVKKIEIKQTDTGSIRIFEYKADNVENPEKENKEVKELNEECDKMESSDKLEQEMPKLNKFLENLEIPTKAFQRKKRIAFDVMPTKSKPVEVPNVSISKVETPSSPVTTLCRSTEQRHGLGFQKEQCNVVHLDLSDDLKEIPEKSNITAKSGISFIKGETINIQTDQNIESEQKSADPNKKDLKCLTKTIAEKLKFLSEGSQTVSAVQIMAIQLQTLLGAWEAGDLKDNYLCNWLTGTGRELDRSEQTAAPPGWDCQWDRSYKRYYYRNTTSGETQWTYPVTDVIGGTEEMDLCLTPPPPDQEEPSLIEQTQTEPQTSKKDPPVLESSKEEKPVAIEHRTVDEDTTSESADLEVPPPPQISNPSPPPPPRIFAKDLKKSKKRRGSINEKNPEIKREKLEIETTPTSDTRQSVNPPLPPSPPNSSQPPLPPHPPTSLTANPPHSEPLPPGVDPPDMTYPLTAPTIEPNMLYTATSQQNNPIYAATLGDPTVPIIDHHAAIMQGQIIHYPTYHQHLHNQQAIIAAANRLTGQDAVQFMVADYTHVYTNSQIIAKPPIKTQRESLGSAINSFYNDIASIEKINAEQELEQQETPSMESVPSPVQQVQLETEQVVTPVDSTMKEKKKKKTKISVSKKQKEISSMVAKWQKAQQHFEDTD